MCPNMEHCSYRKVQWQQRCSKSDCVAEVYALSRNRLRSTPVKAGKLTKLTLIPYKTVSLQSQYFVKIASVLRSKGDLGP